MTKIYNFEKHVKLIEKNHLTMEEFKKKLSYSVIVENQLKYNDRSQFMELISSFLNKDIDIAEFIVELIEWDRKYGNKVTELESDIKILKNFTINLHSDSQKFAELINQIVDLSLGWFYQTEELFESQSLKKDKTFSLHSSELEFESFVKQNFFKLKQI